MDAKSYEKSFILRHFRQRVVQLFVAILFYRLLSIHYLDQWFAWSITLTMLLLPIFCYLLQQSIINKGFERSSTLYLLLYSMAMIWLVAFAVALFSSFAAMMEWSLFFKGGDYSTSLEISWMKLIYNHIIWYSIFGLPAALLARLALYVKVKITSKHQDQD